MSVNINNQYDFDGCTIKTYSISGNNKPFISEYAFKSLLSTIKNNLPHYIAKDFFKGLTVEIWSDLREDIPQSTSSQIDIGDKRYSGLTYSWLKLIKIKSYTIFNTDEEYYRYMSDVLSHELGHYFAHYVGLNDKSSILYQELLKLRNVDIAKGKDVAELIAEDFRLLFGSNESKNIERGDHVQANKIKGYKEYLELYKYIYDYINIISRYTIISNYNFYYNDGLFAVQFYEDNCGFFTFLNDHWTYIRKDGVWFWNNNRWNYIKGIE